MGTKGKNPDRFRHEEAAIVNKPLVREGERQERSADPKVY